MAAPLPRLLALTIGIGMLSIAILVIVKISGSASALSNAIEKKGALVFKSDVVVTEAISSLGDGEFIFNGVEIRNPAGFVDAAAIEIPQIRVLLKPTVQTFDRIQIERIDLVQPTVNIFVEGAQSNIMRLNTALESATRRDVDTDGPADVGLSFIADRVHVERGTLTILLDNADTALQNTNMPTVRNVISENSTEHFSETELITLVFNTLMQASKRAIVRFSRAPSLQPSSAVPLTDLIPNVTETP